MIMGNLVRIHITRLPRVILISDYVTHIRFVQGGEFRKLG